MKKVHSNIKIKKCRFCGWIYNVNPMCKHYHESNKCLQYQKRYNRLKGVTT